MRITKRELPVTENNAEVMRRYVERKAVEEKSIRKLVESVNMRFAGMEIFLSRALPKSLSGRISEID